MTEHKIGEILQKNTIDWMKISGVVGTGFGRHNNKPCIKIYVTQATDQIKKLIPTHIENYEIVVERTGVINARN